MNKILIGSTALKYWFPDFPRDPKDVDYAVESKVEGSTRETEYLVNPILFKHMSMYQSYTYDGEALAPDMLYTLKLSHLAYHDVQWNKHTHDIQWLKDNGCKVIPELFYELYNFWNEYFGKTKRSDLSMNAESFFNNAIKYPVDHDTIHTFLKETPTYTKILKDGAEVEVCELKFNALSFEDKCSLVREEVYVMAAERANGMHYRRAYELMLKKFVLGHAPIWEAMFILDNFKSLVKPEFNYIELIENKVKEYADRYYSH